MKINEYIKMLREKNNLKQEEVAQKLNVDRSTLSKYERGENSIPIDIIKKLAEIYKVPVSNIIYAEDIKKIDEKELIIKLYDDKYQEEIKNKKIKKSLIIMSLLMMSLLIIFLVYYFINTYNSLNIYTITGYNENIKIENGIIAQSKNRIVLSLGHINTKEKINYVILFYKQNNQEKTILATTEINNIYIVDTIDYEEYFDFKNIKNIFDNLYIKIISKQEQIIKLDVYKTFSNNDILFPKDNTDSPESEFNYKPNVISKEQRIEVTFKNQKYNIVIADSIILCESENEHWDYNKDINILRYSSSTDKFLYDTNNQTFITGQDKHNKVDLFFTILKSKHLIS